MADRKTPPKPPQGFDFDRRQAADYLGLSVSTLHSWAYFRRHLPYTVIGNRAWYRQSDLDAFLRRSVIKAEAA